MYKGLKLLLLGSTYFTKADISDEKRVNISMDMKVNSGIILRFWKRRMKFTKTSLIVFPLAFLGQIFNIDSLKL